MLKSENEILTKNSQTKILNRQNGYISSILCHLTQEDFIIKRCFHLFATTSRNERDSKKLL